MNAKNHPVRTVKFNTAAELPDDDRMPGQHPASPDKPCRKEKDARLAHLDNPGFERRAVNATAYRIFRLLEWMIEGPLTLEDLNTRFRQDPQIGREVSDDSVWLYMNTLKALGCRIQRPSPRNRFHYELTYHPFGLPLSEAQLEVLAQVKAHAQSRLTHHEVLALDSLIRKVIHHSTSENPDTCVQAVFDKSRSYDYERSHAQLAAIESAIEDAALLEIQYLSPLKGEEKLRFLPERVYQEAGAVYVRGERPELETPSNLRVDRIQALQRIQDRKILLTLQERRTRYEEIVLHVWAPPVFEGFGLPPHQGIYAEAIARLPAKTSADLCQPEDTQACEITLQARERFYLKQKLLSCDMRFNVISPLSFRQEMIDTLQAMQTLYIDPENTDGDIQG